MRVRSAGATGDAVPLPCSAKDDGVTTVTTNARNETSTKNCLVAAMALDFGGQHAICTPTKGDEAHIRRVAQDDSIERKRFRTKPEKGHESNPRGRSPRAQDRAQRVSERE